ncbi:MAG: hypothetical protein ACI4BA_07675 [Prevotella sp.]
MKKLATKLLVALGLLTSGGAWATDYGFSTSIASDNTVSEKTALATDDGVTVAIARGSQSTGSSKGGLYWGSTTSLTFNAKCERSQYNGAVFNSYQDGAWTGATITIPAGYKLTATKLYFEFAGQDYTWHYKASIVDASGEVLNTPVDEKVKPKSSSVISYTENLSNIELMGTVTIKIHFYGEVTDASKYCCIPVLKLTGTLEENIQTQYFKPTITIGKYDATTGTYSVTMAASDEDGTVSYKIGDGEYKSYSEAISVAPNTIITAKVTGDTYKDSEEASITTGDMPTLATPTATATAYNFAANTYSVALNGPAGAAIKYSTDNWTTSADYSEAIVVVPGATIKAKAEQTNMTTSADMTYAVAAAPVGGAATTPKASGTYSSYVDYNLGAITIPGACIAGTINSGSSSISGSVKTRTNQGLKAVEGDGFYVNVNPGYTITSITIKGLSNQTAANTCQAVYVDGDATNVLGSEVELPLASASTVAAVDIVVSDIQAKDRIEFDFNNSYQGQMLITVEYTCSGDITLNSVESMSKGFATLSAPQNFTVTNGTAYKAQISGNNLVLTALEGIIPAGSGVIVAGEKGAAVTVEYVADDATADMDGNELKGTTVCTKTSDLQGVYQYLMVLQKSTNKFVSYTGEYFPANKAYVLLTGVVNKANQLSIVFLDDSTVTGINGVVAAEDANAAVGTKHIVNGQVVIKTQNGYVNLMGVAVKK